MIVRRCVSIILKGDTKTRLRFSKLSKDTGDLINSSDRKVDHLCRGPVHISFKAIIPEGIAEDPGRPDGVVGA